MQYPYLLFSEKVVHEPVCPALQGDPLIVDLSSSSPLLEGIGPRDQRLLQQRIDEAMSPDFSWGLAAYLEERQALLSDCPQMVSEERFYHLGLDLIVPLGTLLHAPLDAVVKETGYEAGEGNYGGFILLEHSLGPHERFYSLYGHLSPESLADPGTRLEAGAPFGRIGDMEENGNWFYHTHIQVITEFGLTSGYLTRGYCRAGDIAGMEKMCPSSLMLFRR